MSFSRTGLAVGTALAALACSSSDQGAAPTPPSTWGRIQSQIIAPSCATTGCHVTGSTYASESGLAFDVPDPYAALLRVDPVNADARADRLQRLVPRDPDHSFLYRKVVMLAEGSGGRAYGAAMPLGREPLTYGQIEYLRRWILAGAPREGEVVDTAVLANTARPSTDAFTPLAPPTTGVQLHLGPYSVAPDFERELFVYRQIGNTAPLYVTRVQTKMRTSSHHFVLYTFSPSAPASYIPPLDSVRDIRRPDGSLDLIAMRPMGFHVFLAGAMAAETDFSFPPGVALRLPASASIDLNVHYVNRTDHPIPAEGYANLWTTDVSAVTHVARTLNLNNQNIVVPPGQRVTIVTRFAADSAIGLSGDTAVRIIMLTSHMHKHGERFEVAISGGPRDGEMVYSTTSWEHPAIVSFPTPLSLHRGEALVSRVTYFNDGATTLHFGLTSEDEMGIIFGYAY